MRHSYIKCIILPRQARDKHRENSKKNGVFSQAAQQLVADQVLRPETLGKYCRESFFSVVSFPVRGDSQLSARAAELLFGCVRAPVSVCLCACFCCAVWIKGMDEWEHLEDIVDKIDGLEVPQ